MHNGTKISAPEPIHNKSVMSGPCSDACRYGTQDLRPVDRVRALFKLGMGTADIASYLGQVCPWVATGSRTRQPYWTEATVYNLLARTRA